MSEAHHTPEREAHPIDEKVHSLMDQRLSTARDLADRASTLQQARARLEEAQRDYVASFKRAEKAGWDRKELTGHLAFEEPGRAPRRRSSTRTKSAGSEQNEEGGAAPS